MGPRSTQPPDAPSREQLARFYLLSELEQAGPAREALAEVSRALRGVFPQQLEAEPSTEAQVEQLTRLVVAELQSGWLRLDYEPFAGPLHERETPDIELPPLGPAAPQSRQESFIAVHLVDKRGAPVKGRPFRIELPDGAIHHGTTDASGFGRARGFTQDGVARVTFPDFDELDLNPKNASKRLIIPVGDRATTSDEPEDPLLEDASKADAAVDAARALAGEDGSGSEAEQLLGKLFVELYDKTGRTRHANRTFNVSGPQSFEGKTDADGRFTFTDVPFGDYSLSLALDFFMDDPDATVDIVDAPLVVLDANNTSPQVRMIGAVPRSVLAQLHFFFNTDKTFLLPTALPAIRKVRDLYLSNAPCELLVVGHADTRGGPAFNDKLSLERAEATIAYLKDDVDAWFKFYSDKDAKKCWGKTEDHLMLTALPDYADKPAKEDEVHFFQRTRGLQKVDGTAGEETRKALIKEYMSLDGASLADFVGEIKATAHGCGENFPLDDSGEKLDAAPQDEKRDRIDRRVELYFFDDEFGISPAPPGPNSAANSPQYPLWRKRVTELVELHPGDSDGPKVEFVEIADAHFRTDSAVVLPEGENPDASGAHGALTSVGLIATVLRFNDEHAGRSVFVAGHTDSAAGDQLNDELSQQRAQVALALLLGDRDSFKTLANKRHKAADINQILSWISQAFETLSFDCRPARIGDFVSDVTVRKFQTDYNRNKAALGVQTPDLTVDGSVGEDTWAAFFDCYEFALQQELGEDAPGLATLRGNLTFTDPNRKALGFGERFPIEELGVDNFRSQTNRRVEIHFFEPGEEPDLAQAESDPGSSDLYLPGRFEHLPVPPLVSAKPWQATWDAANTSMLETRVMSVNAPGVPAGTPMQFSIVAVGHGPAGSVSAVAQADSVSASFGNWEDMQGITFLGDDPTLPTIDFTFVVEGGGRVVTPVLPVRYADRAFFKLVLRLPSGDQPLPNEPFVLSTLWGRVNGKTDNQAILDVQGLPPGGASVLVRDHTLAHFGVLDLGSDLDGG